MRLLTLLSRVIIALFIGLAVFLADPAVALGTLVVLTFLYLLLVRLTSNLFEDLGQRRLRLSQERQKIVLDTLSQLTHLKTILVIAHRL